MYTYITYNIFIHISLDRDVCVCVASKMQPPTSQDRCIQKVSAYCVRANFSELCFTSRNDFYKGKRGYGFLAPLSWIVYKKSPQKQTRYSCQMQCVSVLICVFFRGLFLSVCVCVFLCMCVCVCVCARVCCRGLGALAKGVGVNSRGSGTNQNGVPEPLLVATLPPPERMKMKMRRWIAKEEKRKGKGDKE